MLGKHRVEEPNLILHSVHKIDPNDTNVQKINTDCNYRLSDLCEIPKGTRIPSLSITMLRQFLRLLLVRMIYLLVLENLVVRLGTRNHKIIESVRY